MTPNDLECYKAKGTPDMLNYYPWIPNFTPFCSTIARFPDIEVFYFSIGYNGEFAIFEKNWLKIRNLKFQKSQIYFCEYHWEENSGQV